MQQFMQKKADPDFTDRGGGDATYVAKGGDVTEILKKMLMEYEDDLVALNKAEAETKAAYDLADDAKKLAIAASTKSKETKEELLGEKGQELSNTQSDLKEAQDALLADTTVLTDTETTCKKRGDEYEQHMKTREGELEAMQQAIEILTKVTCVRAPEDKGIASTVFTQLKTVRKSARKHTDPRAAVVAVLRKVHSKDSVALSKLADKIEKLGGKQMPGSNTFDQIKNMIQKMIFHLMDEQKNEDEHKLWCDKEITNTELMITEKTEDADSTITQLAEKIQNLKNGISDNQKFIAATEGEITSGTEGGAGVIGMLENCATDFAAMESQARADETAHQDEFDTFLTQAQMDKAARTKDTEMKESRKSRFEEKKSAKEESLDHTSKELEGTQQYRKDLEHACEDGDSSYADRKDARASEITALREAQGILDKAFEEA